MELSPSLLKLKLKTGDNLLASALGQGINWPHLCRVGSCGTCRCKLIKGKISPEINFENILDQEQLKDGYILACKSSVRTDLMVEVNLQNVKPE